MPENPAIRSHAAYDEVLARLPDLPADGRVDATRLAVVLKAAINDGTFALDDAFPPSATLARRFSISVDAARAGLGQLVSHGLARREKGGTTRVGRRRTASPTPGEQ